jgi:hypothetical protein
MPGGTDDIAGTDWSDEEIDQTIALYLEMRHLDLSGQDYVKAEFNRRLQGLTGRGKGAIEFKFQNVSAVLQSIGQPWIWGYKPLANFQHALLAGVERRIETGLPDITVARPSNTAELGEAPALLIGPAPAALQLASPPDLQRLIRKVDQAARDARNRSLGEHGEKVVLAWERERLGRLGRNDLARRVEWTSKESGDGAGFDIRSFEPNGSDRLIEVKTTAGHEHTPFWISENERSFAEERPDAFRLVRVYHAAYATRPPRAFEIVPPLGQWLDLRASTFRATLRVR